MDLDKLKAVVEAAPAGPWEHRVHIWEDLVFTGVHFLGTRGFNASEARFIATFNPTLVRKLLAVVEAARNVMAPVDTDKYGEPGIPDWAFALNQSLAALDKE